MTRTRPARPAPLARPAGGPSPVEYLALFLGVVAGILALVR